MTDMGGFLSHNNIVIGFRHDPSPYVLYMGQALAPGRAGDPALTGQAVSLSLRQRGMEWGLALQNSQGTCRSTDIKQFWVVAQKTPMSLKFPGVCPS